MLSGQNGGELKQKLLVFSSSAQRWTAQQYILSLEVPSRVWGQEKWTSTPKGLCDCNPSIPSIFSPHAGPSGAYSPEAAGLGYMMDGQSQMLAAAGHRPPGDPAYHNEYHHYPAQYYGHL
ncbi:Uncharacterized protein FWK35_00018546 [Aphis craccivora]|uniref:Uncharacterized protein n=1 Tax=Aphis craccivora TaxID=307492 RepID=A0A6G0Z9V6_APHCR|nr:Uncharacterized protein FWK35_00018546 [Aphis craccivora]